jgi:hypothetical protein
MSLFARRTLVFVLVLAAIMLAACEEATPTPRPPTRPRPSETPAPTETSTLTPLPPTPTATATNTIVPVTVVQPTAVPKSQFSSIYLPNFGTFPPKAIPSRPSNINPLTGLTADPAKLQRRPILARIGNDQIVRDSFWQSGTTSADIVFEELIDVIGSQYANTRYTAVFLANDPPIIGPIRSGRIINFQEAPMMDGALSHAGASDGTRWLFSQSPMVNLDEYFNQPAYCYQQTHGYQGRLYTTGPRLREWLAQKKWEQPVQLYGFNFNDSKPAGTTINTIGFTKAPWPAWDVTQWQYNAASGKYMRTSTGSPQMDTSYSVTAKWGNGADCVISGTETKTQVSASNVVVLFAPHEKTTIVEDSNNAVSVYINLVGQGDAQFFRDGVMVKGKWQRASEQEFFNFFDSTGASYNLKPGNTWFEIVPIGYSVDVK